MRWIVTSGDPARPISASKEWDGEPVDEAGVHIRIPELGRKLSISRVYEGEMHSVATPAEVAKMLNTPGTAWVDHTIYVQEATRNVA